MTWPTVVDDDLVIHYMQLDETAVPTIDRNLDLPPGRARLRACSWRTTGQVHLVWVRRPEGSAGWQLWQALIDDAGTLQRQANSQRPI